MQPDNPFSAPETPGDFTVAASVQQRARTARLAAPRWWLCTWLGTAVAGFCYGVCWGLSTSVGAAAFVGVFGFIFAFAAGFLTSSTGLLPLLLLRSRLTGRWFPLLLSAVCGGIAGQLCVDWTAGCTGAVVAGLTLRVFGWPRSEVTDGGQPFEAVHAGEQES